MLMVMMAVMTGQLWRYFAVENANLTDRVYAARELRLALQCIGQDMGPVVWAQPLGPNKLMIDKQTPDGNEVIVQYSLTGGQLWRSDPSGAVFPIADGVVDFVADNPTDTLLRTEVTVRHGSITRTATLFWSSP